MMGTLGSEAEGGPLDEVQQDTKGCSQEGRQDLRSTLEGEVLIHIKAHTQFIFQNIYIINIGIKQSIT